MNCCYGIVLCMRLQAKDRDSAKLDGMTGGHPGTPTQCARAEFWPLARTLANNTVA